VCRLSTRHQGRSSPVGYPYGSRERAFADLNILPGATGFGAEANLYDREQILRLLGDEHAADPLRVAFRPWSFSRRADIVVGMEVSDQLQMIHPGHRPGAATTVLLNGVSRRYQVGTAVVTALDGVDLEIDAGEFAVVLGPSGSGKTTLLNIIGALDTATSGHVTLAGRDITGARRAELFRVRREIVSFIFQSFNLFPTLTALENVQCGVEITRKAKDARERAIEVLGEVGLADRLHHYPGELSGGEQQRVAIARALATGNPLLLADEPTGDLDFRTGVKILELLQAQAAAGHTVIVVTHNREISRIADRVIELGSGAVMRDGPPVGGKADIASLRW
jgi:putative ABC transport system ATP-binding protein